MLINLKSDYPLRGTILEHAARILVRRERSNNFVFCCRYFDSIDEIIDKYRLEWFLVSTIVNDLRRNGLHSDLIEFNLNNHVERKVLSINFYDAKSRLVNSERKYFEMCASNYDFMIHTKNLGCGTFIVSMIMLKNWCFEFDILDFTQVNLRVYDSSIKKTLFFSCENSNITGDI